MLDLVGVLRRIREAHPALFRRFGPELVGLYAENGHGALAPSVCEPSPAHSALFRRDVPGLDEVAHDLERHASHDLLGRALRARCAGGGAEWDYTTARLLLALDRAPGFARQLLRAAVAAQPDNGWFRLYAAIVELRDGRLGAAHLLCTPDFKSFCGTEAGAVRWVAALEAVRGFPHVALALRALLEDACGSPLALAPTHLGTWPASADPGDFPELHAALDRSRTLTDARSPAHEAVLTAATAHVSPDAAHALLRRWLRTWQDAEERPASVWGQNADVYIDPAKLPGGSAAEAQERARWMALAAGERIPAPRRLGWRLRRAARDVISPA